MSGLIDPAGGAFSVTPSDTADLERNTTGIFVGSGGNLKVDMVSGETVTFAVGDNTVLPIQTKRVYSTGTTATSIVALY